MAVQGFGGFFVPTSASPHTDPTRMGTAPNRERELSPGPNHPNTDWRAGMQPTPGVTDFQAI